MYLGVIADDFTGASDIANTLAKGGLATRQYFGIPKTSEDGDWAAGLISLKSRSIDADDAVAQSLAALEWLKAQGCRQFIFKYCSTFDSTPHGNIGPVGEALASALKTAIAANKPYLIDVDIAADINPAGAGVWELPGLGMSKPSIGKQYVPS
jgi:uncharacterized protein YgbK (DUF1537 family)